MTFVTPVYEHEIELLELQARSFAVHLDPAQVHQIIVLDNTARGLRAPDRLIAAYGPLADKVLAVRPAELGVTALASGWRSQQIEKLAVAQLVDTPAYVALDAKNHWLATPEPGFFAAPDGRLRVRSTDLREHPLRPKFNHVMGYLGIDPELHVDRFAATVTPFPLITDQVKALMAELEQRSGRSFAEEFIRADLTEFFLYAGWLVLNGGLESRYELTDQPSLIVWPRAAATPGRVHELVAASSTSPLFGLHRDAVPLLSPASVSELAELWASAGLVDDVGAGEALVARMAALHQLRKRRQQLRDLSPRTVAVLRRWLRNPAL